MKWMIIVFIMCVSIMFVGCDDTTSTNTGGDDNNTQTSAKATYNFVATVDGDAVEAYWNIYEYWDVSDLPEIDEGIVDVDNECVIKGNLTAFHYTMDFNSGTKTGLSQTTVYPTGKLEYRISKTGYEIETGTVWISEGQSKTKIVELTEK